MSQKAQAAAMRPEKRNRAGFWVRSIQILVALATLYFLVKHAFPRFVVTAEAYGEIYWDRRYWLVPHLVSGLPAIFLGAFQFLPALRQRGRPYHRWIGRTYVLFIIVSALTAIGLTATAPFQAPLYVSALYFGSAAWLMSAVYGWSLIRRRKMLQHRAWMIRSFALTFFFVTFFALYDAFEAVGLVAALPLEMLIGAVWLAILIPLVIAEIAIRRL